MSDHQSYQQLKIKIKLYIKTIAFVVLIGGYTIYNVTNDSLRVTQQFGIHNDVIQNIKNMDMRTLENIPNIIPRNIRDDNKNSLPDPVSIVPVTVPVTPQEHFCPIKAADPSYMAVVYFFGVIYLFIGLAIIADDFFCPALDVIAEDLNLSSDVAGATLMAAGGSAPELFANLVGTFLRSDVGFGTIVGSAVFNVLFVVGFCSLVTVVPMQLSAWPLMRDSFFYSITLIILALFFGVFSPQRIELYEALVLFALYWVYVFVMYHNTTLKEIFEKLVSSPTPLAEKNAGITNSYGFQVISEGESAGGSGGSTQEGKDAGHKGDWETGQEGQGEGRDSFTSDIARTGSQESISNINKYRTRTPRSGSFSNNYRSDAHLSLSMTGRDIVRSTEEEETEGGGGISMAFPPAQAGYFAWFWYITTFPLFLIFINTIVDVKKEGKQTYAIAAFMACLAWMGLFSYYLVCWVEIIGATLGIPSVIMGLTFLAAGTSVPDMLAAVIVAKKGQGDKAVSSSIGSNVFDITVGLAFPWLLFNIIYKIPVVVIADGFLISIIILFLTLLVMLLTIKYRDWTLPKSSGYFFIFLYFVYVIQQVARSPYGEC